jgi:predicted transposase/invertase (TIGR01784 family)
MKFIDPKNDLAFKKIFGNSKKKNILISFLNAVLDLTGKKQIKDVTVLNPYQIPKLEGLKETVLDVRAVDKTGKEFIVEMQIRKKEDFTKRSLYYTAKTYTSQLKKGEDFNSLRPVIFIGILNFKIFPEKDFLSRHLIINIDSQKQHLKDFEFNFIELPKFNKTESQLKTIIDQWIYFLKETPNLKIIPKHLNHDLAEAYETANQNTWTEEELEVFEYWELEANTETNLQEKKYKEGVKKGKDEGIKEGKEEGIKEGIEQGIEKAIENLMKVQQISKIEAKQMLKL